MSDNLTRPRFNGERIGNTCANKGLEGIGRKEAPRPQRGLGRSDPNLSLHSAGFHYISVSLAATEQTSQAQQAEQPPIIKTAIVVDVPGWHPLVRRSLSGDW